MPKDTQTKPPSDLRRSPLLRQTDRDISVLEARLRELRDVVKSELPKAKVKCLGWMASYGPGGCGVWSPLISLTYLQTVYTDRDGDSSYGEGAFICPKCGKRNRLIDRPHLEALRPHFKDIKKEYA